MGRKKKKSGLTKKQKELLIIIISVIIAIFGTKFGVWDSIDDAIRATGLAEIVNTVGDSSFISAQAAVKTDTNIVNSVSESIKIQSDKLNIIYLNVGQADSIFIECNGKTLLIDAGNANDGEKIVNAIRALGVNKLDYVIGTHVHEDHIGGMSYIVDSFDIGTFYLPYNSTNTTTFYKKLLTSLSTKNISISEASVNDTFELGGSECIIKCVDNSDPDNINEESIVLQLNYGTQKYLFMGDAETSNEKKGTWEDIDVLKVGHHGSNTSSSEDFLEQILPEVAIISVGKDNSYGLPKDKILDRLNKLGSKIYRTDEDGTIQIVSDGNTNEIIKIDLSLDGDND